MLMRRSRKASNTKPTKNLFPLQFAEENFPPFSICLLPELLEREPTTEVIIHWLGPFQSWFHNLVLKIC